MKFTEYLRPKTNLSGAQLFLKPSMETVSISAYIGLLNLLSYVGFNSLPNLTWNVIAHAQNLVSKIAL
jgi:hypothetical protein